VEIYDDADDGGAGKVAGIKFERMQLDGTGHVKGTGEMVDYPVQAVYRAIGYHGSALDELEYDAKRGVIPNEGGRVLDADGNPVPGIYTTGWIKRGPVGLIGHTKGDALETIGFLLEDRLTLPPAQNPDPQAIIHLLEERGIEYTTWEGWNKLDAHEAALGAAWTGSEATDGIVRERIKVVPREEMISISRG
jgi:ferredoxin--NADP+ reductase